MQFPSHGIQKISARSERDGFDMSLRASIEPLRDFVRGYCVYEEERPDERRHQHLPHRDVTFILSLGGELEVIGPNADGQDARRQVFREGEGFVAGIHTRPAQTSASPTQRGIQVSVTPLGAHRLLGGMPMDQISDQTCSLDALLGRACGELAARLSEADRDDERFALLDSFFGDRVLRDRPPIDAGVLEAWRLLDASRGRIKIGRIASELGWSRKRLVTRFREQIGHPPKTIARVLRFDHAMELLKTSPELRWSDVALTCGYADQSHLTHEVRELSGQTPMALSALLLPESGGMAAA